MTTLRQQQRDVLDYLTLACQAATLGSAPTSLVPAAPPAPPPLTRLAHAQLPNPSAERIAERNDVPSKSTSITSTAVALVDGCSVRISEVVLRSLLEVSNAEAE